MSKTHSGVASFVLRFTQDLWQDANGQPQVRWRGLIRHVQGNRENRFTDFSEAVKFIQQNLAELTVDTVSGKNMKQEEVLRESFKFWEDFSAVYSGMMFEALEHSLKQSEAVKQQMQEAVEKTMYTWNPQPQTTASDQKELLDTLNALQMQVIALTQKVEALEDAMQAENSSSK